VADHAVVYTRREPEHTALWQCVEEHLPQFMARAAEAERALPQYVRKELAAFLDCGRLDRGFARVRCETCDFTRLVAFSCKGRGVCPSCIARRMSDTAAHLVEHVLPEVPVRQWVLSVPVPLRYLLAWDTTLASHVVGLFIAAVFRHLRRVAKHELGLARLSDAHPGAICMVQRWGGSVNLNVHLHCLVPDGVFVCDQDGVPRFRALPAPSPGDIAAVAWDVCERVVALLRKRGQWLDAPPEDDDFANREPLLAALFGASIQGTLVMGARAGQRQVRLFGAAARDDSESRPKVKNAYGFDVDAGVRVAAHDRKGLERLARYMLRPPLAKDRIERLADGRYRIRLKKPWRDGTTDLVLEGVELVGRLAALVPPPRAHLTRYYGVFAPRARLRRLVVPARRDAVGCQAPTGPEQAGEPARQHKRRTSWAALLARVFAVDVLACPRCSSRMQRVEWCTHPTRIRAVLAATGPPEAPERAKTA
jgi:hypothetical protein